MLTATYNIRLSHALVANQTNGVKLTCNDFGITTAPNTEHNIFLSAGSIFNIQDHAVYEQQNPGPNQSINTHNSFEIEFIRQMAWKCPVVEGYANARSILFYLFNEEVPECTESEIRKANINNEEVFSGVINNIYLGDNYPEPFNQKTNIPYFVPEDTEAKIIISDITGKKIAEFKVKTNENVLEIDTKNWNSGIYFFSLNINGKNYGSKQMVLTK